MTDWPRPTEAQIENGVDALVSLVRVGRDLNGPIDGPESTWEPTAKQRRRFHVIVEHVLRADAEYRFEQEHPQPVPSVLNMYTGRWLPIPAEDLAEAITDRDGYAGRAQERFRDEWNAEHPEDPRA